VAVVANAMDDREYRNHTCLVLTGEQGRFKTTFLDLLCPPKLQGYSYTGKIYPQKKDTLTYIGQNLIINIDDQLKALNKRDENELKNLITCPMVKYRMPYDKHVEEHPHMASFVVSVNDNDFLADPTGSRRFLPFEVLSIDINRAKAVSMDASMRRPNRCCNRAIDIGSTMRRLRSCTTKVRRSKCRLRRWSSCCAASSYRPQTVIAPT